MRKTRIYHPYTIDPSLPCKLTPEASHHLLKVLRFAIGDEIFIFNNTINEYRCTIEAIHGKLAIASITETSTPEVESPLKIHLAQGIARGDKMDWIIQKAVELGVAEITPIFTAHTQVKLTAQKQEKRMDHWQKVIISACEQSGRVKLPKLNEPMKLDSWIWMEKPGTTLALATQGDTKLKDIAETCPEAPINIAIGPEGGFSQDENYLFEDNNCTLLKLGPRIMRTETAGLAAIAALQSHFGDI